MRNFLRLWLTVSLAALIVACGGRGSGGSNTPSDAPPTPPPVIPSGDNVQPISVNAGPVGTVNLAFTSVTVCVPGTSQCRTIDNVILDTGSTGLRVLASALGGLTLPVQTSTANRPLAECVQFVDLSYMWGPIKRADVKIANKIASSVPIQVAGDNSVGNEPITCGGGDPSLSLDSLDQLGGNGILGIGQFIEDCGEYCVTEIDNEIYYHCLGTTCTTTTATLASQLQNPIARFSGDNNGVVIDLPAISELGSARVDGWMIFGIGTRDNNALGGAVVHTTDDAGYLTTRYKGVDLEQSFIDSGSNGLYFPDDDIPWCNDIFGFYCPSTLQYLSGTLIGINQASSSVTFTVANTETLNLNFAAFKNLAGPYSFGFDWGLPFFFGRKVYTGFETEPQGPYVAF